MLKSRQQSRNVPSTSDLSQFGPKTECAQADKRALLRDRISLCTQTFYTTRSRAQRTEAARSMNLNPVFMLPSAGAGATGNRTSSCWMRPANRAGIEGTVASLLRITRCEAVDPLRSYYVCNVPSDTRTRRRKERRRRNLSQVDAAPPKRLLNLSSTERQSSRVSTAALTAVKYYKTVFKLGAVPGQRKRQIVSFHSRCGTSVL